MSVFLSKYEEFSESRLYSQWLYRGKTWPLTLNKYLIPILWFCCIFYIIVTFTDFIYISRKHFAYRDQILAALDVFRLLLISTPFILTALDFLWFCPKAIFDDTRRRLLELMSITLIKTRSVMPDLRKFIATQNLKHIAPSLVFAVFYYVERFYFKGPPGPGWFDFFEFWGYTVVGITVWWFLLESSVFASFISKSLIINILTLIAWLVVIIAGVYLWGTLIANLHWNHWYPDFYTKWRSYPEITWYISEGFWDNMHYSVLLALIAAFIRISTGLVSWIRRRRGAILFSNL